MKVCILGLAVSALCLVASVQSASAQATRTYVSGTGDDANPCSRTAPCKTFPGAISKTAANGEIDALDTGGFGTLTITKAITIDGQGVLSSILSSGTVGITVNAGANDRVVLRNMEIQGVGSGTIGINFVNGYALTLQNVTITNTTQQCVNFQPSIKAFLIITDSSLQDCVGGGLNIGSGSGESRADVERTTITRSGVGVTVGQAKVLIKDSFIDNNPLGGMQVTSSNGFLVAQSTSISNNQTFGISATGGGRVGLSQSSVILNAGPAFQIDSASSVASFSNNYVAGNSPDTLPTSTIAPE